MSHVLPLPVPVDLPVAKISERFPVRRVYGVHRNYEAQHGEAEFRGGRPPGFYCKPADLLRPVDAGEVGDAPCPLPGQSLYFEVGLILAIGKGGRRIRAADAAKHIYGFAVGLDMSRSDAPKDAKPPLQRSSFGSTFDMPTYIGPIVQAADVPGHAQAQLWLQVNGTEQQRSTTARLLWSVSQIVEYLSAICELHPGDLIYTGTPEGIGMAGAGDLVIAVVDGVGAVALQVARRAKP
ncbi:fumarylacetoacetate hydrolase family protein [Rhodoferax sp.]|uniref:fumarylacetoacetate hydrolase family protein n=1 Tax=Rhodoferax sp. TaxID=50421 RepID=UPI00271C17E7|nr:fumarylacetoacetate hydrolase family protein [Rhodoferax sp.]MDO9195399.1 fumarylacetoacetate hydrolase family protein [Rhodoferax sp.]